MATTSKRGPGRPPGARNKNTAAIKEAAAKHGPAALATLVKLMDDEDQPGAVRKGAADSILDRAYGKPAQTADVSVRGEVVTKEQRDAAYAAAMAADD